MRNYLYGLCCCVMGVALGCAVQHQSDQKTHQLTKWERLGKSSAKESCYVHAAIFREAAANTWEGPGELSAFLVKRVSEELPKTYQPAGALLAIEFADGWDTQKASDILNELADGYEEIE